MRLPNQIENYRIHRHTDPMMILADRDHQVPSLAEQYHGLQLIVILCDLFTLYRLFTCE
jgi:hypothetical protein